MNSDHQSLADFVKADSADLFGKARAFSEFLKDAHSKGYAVPYLQPLSGPSSNIANLSVGQHDARPIQMNTANYLGLASDSRVLAAAHQALDQYGASMCGVPLIAGTTAVHKELETELASFKNIGGACLFQTGYAANIGVIAALAGKGDYIVIDESVHASILEGAKLAGSRTVMFRHSDCNHLEEVLRSIRLKHAGGLLVVIEGVYGIDGDIPPALDIARVARSHGARLMVDDCHATGVLGSDGSGLAAECGLTDGFDIVMDSLSKALGSIGGWIGAPQDVCDYLRYFARPIVFSVGLSPVSAAAALAALRIIKSEPALVARVRNNAELLRSGLYKAGVENVMKSHSSIMSILIGDELKLRKMSAKLFEEGLWVEGIPYPAVPRGQERIRLRANAMHTEGDLARAIELLKTSMHRHGVV